MWRCPISLDNADSGSKLLRIVGPGEVADQLLRADLGLRMPNYIAQAIGTSEFDSIGYYNLDREEISSAVARQLRDQLRTAQLGNVAELYERAEEHSKHQPTLRNAVRPWKLSLSVSVLLLLLSGSVLSALRAGNGLETALLFGSLAIACAYAVRRGQIIRRQFNNARSESASAWRRFREAVVDEMVSPVIREIINDRLYHYDRQLTVRSSPGLMTDDPLFWIDTDNSRRLLNLMAVMPGGGSIGVAGPRGCGKTTLLEHCALPS